MNDTLGAIKEQYENEGRLDYYYNKLKTRAKFKKMFRKAHNKEFTDNSKELVKYYITAALYRRINQIQNPLLGSRYAQGYIFGIINYFDKEVEKLYLKKIALQQKKERKKIKKEMMKRAKKAKKRAKEQVKKSEKKRKYEHCVNDKDYILLDDVDDFEKNDIVNFHYNKKIHCVHKVTIPMIFNENQKIFMYQDENSKEIYKLPLNMTIYITKTNGDKVVSLVNKVIQIGINVQ